MFLLTNLFLCNFCIHRYIPSGDLSQTATARNPQSLNYGAASKPTMIQTGTYQPQALYQFPSAQQQIILGTYPYSTLSPAVKLSNKYVKILQNKLFITFR